MNAARCLRTSAQFALALWAGAPSSAFAADPGTAPPKLTVDALVTEILDRNPELDFYRAEIAAAKGGRRTAAQWNNPEVSVELGHKRVWDRLGPSLGDGMVWAVSVAQTFEYPGRMALRKAIANRQVELAEIGLAQFRTALAVRARTQASGALAAQQKAEAAHEVAQRLRDLLAVLVQRDPAGVAPLLDQRIIEATAITLQRRALQADRELQGALLELNQLRGAPAGTPLALTGVLSPPAPAPALSDLLQAAATGNFELRLRQTELAQQGFQVQLARSERRPKVTLAPFYASEKANDEQRIVGLGVSVPLPLWDQNKGNLETARAREQQAEASLRATQREIERRLTEHALALQAKLGEIARWQADAPARFREAAETADRHFRLGAVPVTTYIEMQLKYLDAIEALSSTLQEAIEHRLQVALLTGQPLAAGNAQ